MSPNENFTRHLWLDRTGERRILKPVYWIWEFYFYFLFFWPPGELSKFSHQVSPPPVTMSLKDNACKKFQANIFNKSKCQNCFKPRESHLLNDEDLNQVNIIFNHFTLWTQMPGSVAGSRKHLHFMCQMIGMSVDHEVQMLG